MHSKQAKSDTSSRKIAAPQMARYCLSTASVRQTKAAGLDNVPAHVLRECIDQLADVLTELFNISLSQTVVPSCFKTTTIIPVPEVNSVWP